MASPEFPRERRPGGYNWEYLLRRMGLLVLSVGGAVVVLAKADDLADLLNPPTTTIYTEIKPSPNPSILPSINPSPLPRGILEPTPRGGPGPR